MERFSFGREPTLSKKEREKQRKRKRTSSIVIQTVVKKRPCWRILPCKSPICFTIDLLKGTTFFAKMKEIDELGLPFLARNSKLSPNHKISQVLLERLTALKSECKKILVKNQKLRWKFKHFVSLWRLKRMKKVNDTDFVTMSNIEKPVSIAIFSTNSIYTFEAFSILREIHKKLLHHDGQIPSPMFPRNPYTNETFTFLQMIQLHKQCKEKGQSIWSLELFAKYNYNINLFLQHERKVLRINAIKSLLANLSDWQGHDLLLNFIESQHEEHEIPFQKLVYGWSIHHIPDEERIRKWKLLCSEYYINDILAEDQSDKDLSYFIVVDRSAGLCSYPSELFAKRTLFLQMKKDGTRNRLV
jgi:hypothetical protein